MLGRTQVSGEDDLAEGRRAQRLAARDAAAASAADPPPPLPNVPLAPYALPEPRAAFFDELATILASNPAPSRDAPLLARLAEVGVVPGATPSEGSPAVLEAGLARGLSQMGPAITGGETAGWSGNFKAGAYGTDYLTRARVARNGLGASVPEQALYYFCRHDGDGEPLTGQRRYRIRFPADGLPPFLNNGFWSLTMYASDLFLVPNKLGRHAVGNRSEHLAFEPGRLAGHLPRDRRPPLP